MAQLAALEAAMGEMEAARATFEAKVQAVSDELASLQEQVMEFVQDRATNLFSGASI